MISWILKTKFTKYKTTVNYRLQLTLEQTNNTKLKIYETLTVLQER